MTRSSYRVLASLAAAVLFLTACYFPWPSEKEARRVGTEKLRSTLEGLPRPGKFTVPKSPGTSRDDVNYRGNYRGQSAWLEANFFTSLSPEEACRVYLAYVLSRPQWKLTESSCDVGAGPPYVGRVVATEEFPSGSNEVFSLRIAASVPFSPSPEGAEAQAQIFVNIHYSMDRHADSSCRPNELTGESRCVAAYWSGLE